jgi:hypothetical protein
MSANHGGVQVGSLFAMFLLLRDPGDRLLPAMLSLICTTAPSGVAHQTSHEVSLFLHDPAVSHGEHYRKGQGAAGFHLLQPADGVVLEAEAYEMSIIN